MGKALTGRLCHPVPQDTKHQHRQEGEVARGRSCGWCKGSQCLHCGEGKQRKNGGPYSHLMLSDRLTENHFGEISFPAAVIIILTLGSVGRTQSWSPRSE